MPDQTTPASPPPAGPPPEAGPAARTYKEDAPPRGLYVRVFIYVVASHVLLAFLSFLVIVAKTR
ncbi:DUF6126 family protein [Streptomyces angustmyceticus]|uniref:Small hydrophobic protein n=1 Tax=Streptomyces angustmyceticus TaxID=285578 RepID=A0A5J4L953_9ACTN|nr:DUF6126 family protein [Streptomyces angustmyceticus]UAL66436.1 DUF6126 family protein [Streptomyces angustmyceticus]GES28752.1 hypothetical protein San01_12390 [Streptomyces angustmyceticus]